MSEHYGHVTGQWFYGCDGCWGGDPNADAPDKRLTDAELAAEVQRAVADMLRAKGRDAELNAATDRMLTMTRFATAPDHDTPG